MEYRPKFLALVHTLAGGLVKKIFIIIIGFIN